MSTEEIEVRTVREEIHDICRFFLGEEHVQRAHVSSLVDAFYRLRERQWQPIATAPKDGSEILLFGKIGTGIPWYVIAKWDEDFEKFVDAAEYTPCPGTTHWMPLPEPPKEQP